MYLRGLVWKQTGPHLLRVEHARDRGNCLHPKRCRRAHSLPGDELAIIKKYLLKEFTEVKIFNFRKAIGHGDSADWRKRNWKGKGRPSGIVAGDRIVSS